MPEVLSAALLTLKDIHQNLKMEPCWDSRFEEYLVLKPLPEHQEQELLKIRADFLPYLESGTVSEGTIKLLLLAPLLKLTGFYQEPFHIDVEESIGQILEADEEMTIRGRMDILITKKQMKPIFWILIIEDKKLSLSVQVGLAQLLAYLYKGLQNQSQVWGLVTNGFEYQFILAEKRQPIIYHLMPLLNLLETEKLKQILQVLNGIREQ